MLVRDATAADLPTVSRLLDWPETDLAPPRRCLVAEESQIVGALLASCPVPEEAEILDLAVDPAHRQRGIGSRLLKAFLAGRRGRVFLEVRPSNVAARRLYEHFGFTEISRRAHYYRSSSEDAIVMQVTLYQ